MFSWSEAKNASNRRKHGVSFESAQLVFDDPMQITSQDRIENGELRWQTMGMAAGITLIVVAHTWEMSLDTTEHIRIISARRASRQERKSYEQGI